MLDALVTLIAFLLFSMSFLAIVSIESPAPVASKAEVQQKLKEKPLQLTLTLTPKGSQIWSPFGRIETTRIANSEFGPDLPQIHQALVKIKAKFPEEKQIVLVPHPGVNYDTLVAVMDAIRSLEKTDTAIFVKSPKTGLPLQAQYLFPSIVFGNLLGDS